MGRTIAATYILHIILLNFLQFTAATDQLALGAQRHHKPGCSKRERDVHLSFKQRLTDPDNLLSSWHGDDCCSWRGVGCDAPTGHVVYLDLGFDCLQSLSGDIYIYRSFLGQSNPFKVYLDLSRIYKYSFVFDMLPPPQIGDIDPSLANLTHLRHLDLSFNSVNLERFLPSIGSLTQLVYLDLSHIYKSPVFKLPPQLGNLSRLRHLDLRSSWFMEFDNLRWLSGLSSLQLLDLSDMGLGKMADWLTSINMVPTLAVLRLSFCGLPRPRTYISHINLTSLAILDLSINYLNSTFPDWLLNLTSLKFLDLTGNNMHGRIPASLGSMTSLEDINYLGYNDLQGEIPAALGNICNLRKLDLSFNNIMGGISELLEGWSRCGTTDLEELKFGVQ